MVFSRLSNPGGRAVNEDCVGTAVFGDSFCFAVADGLGGHGGGDAASQAAVEAVCGLFAESGYSDAFFDRAFSLAQEEIVRQQQEGSRLHQMRTTLVVLVLHGGKAFCAHVGDSRGYLFTRGKMKFHTVDHSVPQMLATLGEIREEDIRFHPDRNRLLAVLGDREEAPVPSVRKPVRISGFQAYLLCTDGFWELIDEREMLRLLQQSDTPEQWLSAMEQVILANGDENMDNYSAIAVFEEKKGLFG